ncbi:MAG: sulfite exporter TauE/SafE family protein [Candidatus Aenigmarchaeota archaeon]|nr:sulfite exporter TauE/SafE family protein [Candidatus Aenigmarchaeota archaeon]
MPELTVFVAFVAGLFSFVSPCILPLIPAFLSYLSGVSLSEAGKSSKSRIFVFMNAAFFVLGFSLVFSILGVLLSSILSDAAYDLRLWLGRIGGVIIIAFGLYLMKLIRLTFLEKEHKMKVRRFGSSYATSFAFGVAFAAGWTPCVGAILGSILALAAVQPQNAFSLLLAYSAGLGIPFLLSGLFISRMQPLIKKHSSAIDKANMVFGAVLVILGILVFTNMLASIASIPFLNQFLQGGI